MLFVFLLLMLEAGVTADVFLNRDWDEVYFMCINSFVIQWLLRLQDNFQQIIINTLYDCSANSIKLGTSTFQRIQQGVLVSSRISSSQTLRYANG